MKPVSGVPDISLEKYRGGDFEKVYKDSLICGAGFALVQAEFEVNVVNLTIHGIYKDLDLQGNAGCSPKSARNHGDISNSPNVVNLIVSSNLRRK